MGFRKLVFKRKKIYHSKIRYDSHHIAHDEHHFSPLTFSSFSKVAAKITYSGHLSHISYKLTFETLSSLENRIFRQLRQIIQHCETNVSNYYNAMIDIIIQHKLPSIHCPIKGTHQYGLSNSVGYLIPQLASTSKLNLHLSPLFIHTSGHSYSNEPKPLKILKVDITNPDNQYHY